MGGQDWELWVKALDEAGVLADGFKTVAYSYIGAELTWPIYWGGTLGKAKEDLDRAAKANRSVLANVKGDSRVAVLKSVVTQASSAIPVMPLYISLVFKVMREKKCYESVIEHIFRLFKDNLYGSKPEMDKDGRIRNDTWELQADVQNKCSELWKQVTTQNLRQISDYDDYKKQFLQLFGFDIPGVDYKADQNPEVEIPGLVNLVEAKK